MRERSVPDLAAPAGRSAGWAELVPQCCWQQQSLWRPCSSVGGNGSSERKETLWRGSGVGGAYLHWDVVVHGAGKVHGAAVVGEGPHDVEVAGHGAHEVQPQVAEGDQGVPQQTETLADLNQSSLVLLPLLQEKHEKPALKKDKLFNRSAALTPEISSWSVFFTLNNQRLTT